MNKSEHELDRREKAKGLKSHNDGVPYWKRAHRDWRVIGVILLMLVAMGIYIFTEDLAWGPRGRNQPPMPEINAQAN